MVIFLMGDEAAPELRGWGSWCSPFAGTMGQRGWLWRRSYGWMLAAPGRLHPFGDSR